MTTNREDSFADKKSGEETGENNSSTRKRQRVRLTREEMQAMTERKRRYETGADDDEGGIYEKRSAGYSSRPRRNYDAGGDGDYARRKSYRDDDGDKQAPSYRDRYRAEHSGEGEGYKRNNYRPTRNEDRGGYDEQEGGYKPRRQFSPNRPYGQGKGQDRTQGKGGFEQREQRKGQGGRGNKPNFFPKGKGQKPQNNRPQKQIKPRPRYEFEEQSEPETSVRLNKFLAHAGVASRREADQLILAGAVVVNGTPVLELGTKVAPTDRVEVNGKVLTAEEKVYILLNKPRNVVTTTEDPQERLTVLNLVRNAATERIYPVGRLDRNTTGVLLLTNDGDLASKLVHPSFKKKKIYQVWLDKEVTPEDMQKLADGVELSDGEMHADAISYVDEEDHTQVGIEIHSGKNRVVRRLFEALGYRVLKLDRVYFAGLTKKNLGRGKWRYLTEQEVINLKNGFFD
ncbi:MAG: pseudouridine synthase [Porphyromonas sp.]|nr:pseudouridine synthase [Bacteroidales bacterium]MDY3101208.1 pseudouridine synthase [Porphyromonas sp.]